MEGEDVIMMIAIHHKTGSIMEYDETLSFAKVIGQGITRYIPAESFKKNLYVEEGDGVPRIKDPIGSLLADIGEEMKKASATMEGNTPPPMTKKKEGTKKKEEEVKKDKTTLKSLCDKLGIDSSKARRVLRSKMESPGKWEWSDESQVKKVEEILKKSFTV